MCQKIVRITTNIFHFQQKKSKRKHLECPFNYSLEIRLDRKQLIIYACQPLNDVICDKRSSAMRGRSTFAIYEHPESMLKLFMILFVVKLYDY